MLKLPSMARKNNLGSNEYGNADYRWRNWYILFQI